MTYRQFLVTVDVVVLRMTAYSERTRSDHYGMNNVHEILILPPSVKGALMRLMSLFISRVHLCASCGQIWYSVGYRFVTTNLFCICLCTRRWQVSWFICARPCVLCYLVFFFFFFLTVTSFHKMFCMNRIDLLVVTCFPCSFLSVHMLCYCTHWYGLRASLCHLVCFGYHYDASLRHSMICVLGITHAPLLSLSMIRALGITHAPLLSLSMIRALGITHAPLLSLSMIRALGITHAPLSSLSDHC